MANVMSLQSELETVKEMLISAARYAESANKQADRNTESIGALTSEVSALTSEVSALTSEVREMGQIVTSNARSAEANSNQMVEIRQEVRRDIEETKELWQALYKVFEDAIDEQGKATNEVLARQERMIENLADTVGNLAQAVGTLTQDVNTLTANMNNLVAALMPREGDRT